MAKFLADPALVEPSESLLCQEWLRSLVNRCQDQRRILATLPKPMQPSYAPLATLSALLELLCPILPVLELQRTYTELWRFLPEDAKAGRASAVAQRLLEHVLRQCQSSYSSLLDFYHPSSSKTAIIDPETGRSARHSLLAETVRNFRLPLRIVPGQPKPVVAISLPNGPLLAMAVLATAAFYTAAPLAHGSGVGKDQFKLDVLRSKPKLVLAAATDVNRLGLREPWLTHAGIPVLLIEMSSDMTLVIRKVDGHSIDYMTLPSPIPNCADDFGLMLFTSGTSGAKKLVPIRVHSIVCGVAMIESSWGLSPSTRCLNQMPLNHVGGLIRNLFAPVFTGGSVICCSAFDANLFWDCVEDFAPTWYYASPSMHQVILQTSAARPQSVAKSQIRLVCNAAGGLLPSLAVQLRETFSTESIDCVVLPSYGMTECMPISTPPLSFRLEKPTTSGVSVGPEVAILDRQYRPTVRPGEAGRIAIRGAPVFGGYLQDDNSIDRSCFTSDGWFSTGDIGYMDQENYLHVTGRSKEVVNRGGELISPFEVEEAIVTAASQTNNPIYGRVSRALAFPVPHEVLQEVVGIAIVTPDGAMRPCLRGIAESVRSVLSQVKMPVVIVYMDGGLPTINNKVLRINLAERLGLPKISDTTPIAGRYFEAVCPPPNMPRSTLIECNRLDISNEYLDAVCASVVPHDYDYYIRRMDLYPELVLACKTRPRDSCMTLTTLDTDQLLESLESKLHGYSVPFRAYVVDGPLPRDSCNNIDPLALDIELKHKYQEIILDDLTPTEANVSRVFAQILSLPASYISSSSDFFQLGGDSLGAGRLMTALRREYSVGLPINVLFTNPKVHQLASAIDEKLRRNHDSEYEAGKSTTVRESDYLPGCEEVYNSTKPILMLLQLLPIGLFYPMKRALTWTIFMYMLTETQYWYTNDYILGRLFDLVVSITVGAVCSRIVAPCLAITFKWLVIGRYREGLYPMWGFYHTRWWMVEKIIAISGWGVFGLCNWTRILYLRLLGAAIGKNVTINKGATLGEWDLITIDDNAVLERCIVRPFSAERNASMYLGRVRIGANASIGLSSIVAAGHFVPANMCIGPNSSSWEMNEAEEVNRDLASQRIPGAHWSLEIFLSLPLQALVKSCGAIPWLASLVPLVRHKPHKNVPDMLEEVIRWFASPNRVAFHYMALAANVALGPIFFFIAVLVVKKLFDAIFGRIQPSSVDGRSQMTKFRMQWLRTVMPAPQFHKINELFGTHYNTTSVLARALGAKVGDRVYWPGTGPSIQDFDLLDIGNDVVFGSRSHLVTSDGTGSDYIHIKSGAMVADRVILLPGVEVGENAVMGSGALAKRNARYASDTTWVGNKAGEAICVSPNAPSASLPSSVDTSAASLGCLSKEHGEVKFTSPDLSASDSTNTAVTVNQDVDSEASSLNENGQYSHSYTVGNVKKRDVVANTQYIPDSRSNTNVRASTESTSPFGRAFYHGKAPYRVWNQFEIFVYSTLITVAAGVYWNVPSVSAVQIVSHMYKSNNMLVHVFLAPKWWRPISLYVFITALIVCITALQTIFVLLGTIAAKWILMGKRQPGNYDWDKSSYCQRWQLFLKLETFRRQCYKGHGILSLLTGTQWIVLYFRAMGAKIGKDCSLFSSGSSSLLFTEPDLLALGDRVSVDDASLVGHINTRGKFDLNPLSVGSRSVLRSGSRLLSGARMEEDTCLLEHTLVMAGDVVDADSTVQGWPAEAFHGKRMPTLQVVRQWRVEA